MQATAGDEVPIPCSDRKFSAFNGLLRSLAARFPWWNSATMEKLTLQVRAFPAR